MRRGYGHGIGTDSLTHAPPFVGEEEESLIATEGAAKRAAEFILFEICGRGIEIPFGVQDIVSQKLVGAAVKGSGSRLGDHIEHRAGVATQRCIVAVREDPKLADGIGRRLDGGRVDHLVASGAAIDIGIVRPRPPAVHGHDSGLVISEEKIRAQCALHTRL